MEYNDLSKKTLRELLEFKDALKTLVMHYEDKANSVVGNYPFDTQEIYAEARKASAKYTQAYSHIVDEIEQRVSKEIYA